jgi:hypothetical protein
MNYRRHIVAIVLCCCSLGIAVSALPQSHAANAVGTLPPATAASSRPSNLKILPKDMSTIDVTKLMVRYQRDLGVQCAFCHDENPDTKQIDYVSDANPMKGTARIMIGMTNDINNKYLVLFGDRRYAEPLICGNCHQGQMRPPAFEPK